MSPAPIYDEIIDFLAAGASMQAIADFRCSADTQLRIEHLIERKKEGTITSAEIHEMEEFLVLGHFMILTKARAREFLQARNSS